jgi:uncharacterized protein (UPF0262 family)
MRELKYRIADWLFEAELDEAFELGIKEGQRRQKVKVLDALDLNSLDVAKTNQKGYSLAMGVVENVIK